MMPLRPLSELVVSPKQFFLDLLDTEHAPRTMSPLQPLPEAGSDIECVVPVLRLDQDVGIDEVHHAALTFSVSPSKVECLLAPSSR